MTDSQRGTGEELKHAILVEARRVLESDGYAALSTRRIASAVGCTATSIYLYYKSKDALVHALIGEGFEELNGRVRVAIEAPGTAQERIERACRAYVDFGLERTSYYEIMFMLRADQMERFPAESYRKARTTLEAFAGLASAPPELGLRVGTTIWASMHGLVALLAARRIDVRLDQETLIQGAIRTACDAALREVQAHFQGDPNAADPSVDGDLPARDSDRAAS